MGALRAGLRWLGGWLDAERLRVYPRATLVLFLLSGLVAPTVGAALGVGERSPDGGDFAAFYTAGHAVLDGRLDVLTNLDAQERYQAELLHHTDGSLWSPWVSPPLLAYAFVPFALLPYGWSCALELFLLAAALALALERLRTELMPTLTRRVLWVQALAFFPLFASLLGQQLTAFFLLLLTLMVVSLRRGHDLRAGLYLGCFAIKPQLAIGVGLYLLFRRRWRAAMVALGCSLAFAIAGYALMPEASQHWLLGLPELMAYMRQGGYPTWGQYGAFGSTALLLDAISPSLASALGALLSVALLVGLYRLAARPLTDRSALAAALTLALLLSPHLYVYDLGLLLVPFALLFGELQEPGPEKRDEIDTNRRTMLRGAVGLVYISCFVGTFISMASVRFSADQLGHGMALQLGVVAILLAAWVASRKHAAEGTVR